ncbi:MAG: transketolase [Deltaproteobacteria bacterium]|nr:transketolase [Deltaproteobacteria bacterium]
MSDKLEKLEKLAKLIRYYILTATTKAGSGHPTSSLSATELMAGLMFGGLFRFDPDHPEHPNNDRLLFSKGHASPLFYALWLAAGKVTAEEMMTYREFGSPLEGHPTVAFPFTEAATGSLGQGLSIGLGIALNAKYLDELPYRTYVLLGDSEMAEGSQWEALQLAAYYKLDNLVGILDVNRLGQRGETMYGHDLEAYRQRISAFGWETILIDGHSFEEVLDAYKRASAVTERPVMVIAKTIKGKGVSFVEDKDGWHGKALSKADLEKALKEMGEVDTSVRGEIAKPRDLRPEEPDRRMAAATSYRKGESIPTRNAYGNALKRVFPQFPNLVSLDGEVSNSTQAEYFKKEHPQRFFEMFVAEQNMVGAALGLATRGKLPFVSTFGAFMSRAFDQIRMSPYSNANIKFAGSHAGVSIGQDGPSQMGLEDIALFRSILESVVLYPCDAVSADRLVEAAAGHEGIVYIRTTRGGAPVIYDNDETFPIGGSKTLRTSDHDKATLIGAGVTLHECLAAHGELKKQGIAVRVIDLYSVKPIDRETLQTAALDTGLIVTVEDHYPEGGLGEAVKSVLSGSATPVHSLAVHKRPRSGKPSELLDYEGISSKAIVGTVKEKLG